MNNLIICGKANQDIPVKKLKASKNDEVWLCGTDIREDADLYFEIHGINVPHKNVIRKFDQDVYYNPSGITVGNTISGMLIYAWLHGYTHITLLGCPMVIKEYPQQRETVVRLVDYLNEHGLCVIWEDKDMAKAQQTQAQNGAEEKAAEQQEVHSKKMVKAKFTTLICASYGTFRPEQVAEIPEDVFKELKAAGFVTDKI